MLHKHKKTMPASAADLEALKAKLADAVKKPITYSQLVPLQAELDAADAARYHDDGSLPETDNVALIDECYGKIRRTREMRACEPERCLQREKGTDERCLHFVIVPCVIPASRSSSSAPGLGLAPASARSS